MGKIVTIYLSDDEARGLQEFCDGNRCTQYSALKTAVKQMLSEAPVQDDEAVQEVIEEPERVGSQEETVIIEDDAEESLDRLNEVEPVSVSPAMRAIRQIRARNQAE